MNGCFLVAMLVIFLCMPLIETVSESQRRFVLDTLIRSQYTREECIMCICFRECHEGMSLFSEKDMCRQLHHFDCAHEDRCTCCQAAEACHNGGTCHNDGGGHFHCICRPGVNGTHCENKDSDVGECSENTTCINGGSCTNSSGHYSCQCANGWSGENCQTDIDECLLNNPCQNDGTCVNIAGSYKCTCIKGSTGKHCETYIDPCLLFKPCQHGGTCSFSQGKVNCLCTSGWKDGQCQTDIDECLLNNTCLNGGTCLNTAGSYTCNCLNGSTGKHCETFDDACLLLRPCQHGGTCSYTQGKLNCLCTSGWTDGQCQSDIDECLYNPCQHGATCSNTPGSYDCRCSSGWTGKNCEIDVDECLLPLDTCENNGSCINVPGSSMCVCSNGWTGDACQTDIDECLTVNRCQNNGICTNTAGTFNCNCTDGWTGEYCQADEDECLLLNSCKNDGSCTNVTGSCTCNCSNGWTGDTCQTDIDECLSVKTCQNNGTCTNNAGSFNCICANGWTGKYCQADVDECSVYNPCDNGGTCTNFIGNYNCHCANGWFGDKCQIDIDECLSVKTCQNNGTCTNAAGSFNCHCENGWTGKYCQADVDECSLYNPCDNGGTCTNSIGNYNCHCANGWYGDTCSKQNNFGICNFDDGNMCTWTQSNQDSFDWTLQSGSTLTDGTGPNNDHTLNTSQGKYLFIETSAPRLAGEEASLLSPELPSDHTVCLEFWYYMFGDGIGSLQVHAQDTHSTNNILLFKKDGNQGESWIKASVTILNKQIPNSYRLVITGNVGLTYTGDTAIDDLALNDGACEDSMTTSTHAAPPSSGSTTAVTNLETSTFVSLTGAHTTYIQHTSPTLAGQWSEWFSSKCSASCGTGTQHRLRVCNAGYCIGPSSDLIPCNELNCTKQEQFPKCNHTCSLNPVIHSTAVLSNGVNCPTNGYGSNDALPLTCCNIYTREKWINGTKIEATGSCIDDKIPPYTPISAFNAGVPTTDKAGIFYGCILNGVSGFMMIRQTCSTLPQLVSITGTEAQNYFVINFRSISALN